MTIEGIRGIVEKLRKRYGNLCVDELCDALGIAVQHYSMGTSENACKGFYTRQRRIKLAFINSDLDDDTQRIILSHETGHGVLHNDFAVHPFHELVLLDASSKLEYEANIFAAEWLLPDDDVLDLLNSDMSFFQAASELYVPPELLDFKLRVLRQLGYAVNNPLVSNSNFMKNIDRPNRF